MRAPWPEADALADQAAHFLYAAMCEAGFPEVVTQAVGPYADDPDNSVTLGHPKGHGGNFEHPWDTAWKRAWGMVRARLG